MRLKKHRRVQGKLGQETCVWEGRLGGSEGDGLGSRPAVQMAEGTKYKSWIRYEMTSNMLHNYFRCLPPVFAHFFGAGSWPGNFTIVTKMTNKCGLAQQFHSRNLQDWHTYRQQRVCVQGFSCSVVCNSQEEKSTGNSQMSGSRDRFRKSWTVHSGTLCSGKKNEEAWLSTTGISELCC